MRLHRTHAALGGFAMVLALLLGGAAGHAGAVCPLPSDPQQQLEVVISIVDVNRDGGLSLAEIQALYPGMTAMYFTLADGNRDGKITAAELVPWLSLLPGMNLLNLVDANLNGAIEYSEVAAYVTPEQFALVDLNGDGVVDCLDIGGGPVEGEGEDPGDPPCPIGDVTADALIRLVLILVDTSGDGSLSLGEVRAVYPELETVYFTLLDSNRNGLLDAGELAALAAFLPLDDFLAEVDLNGDRLVAYAEVSQYVTPAQFALADLNGNGVVDCEDIDLLTGGTDPGEGEGEDPVEGEGEPAPPCPIDFSVANIAAVVVSLLDTNGDGGLSLAEIQAIYPDMESMYFTLLDGNRDGKITAAELAAIAVILPLDSYIGMVDPNGDGVIAYAEVSEYLTQAQFDLIDTNNNGVIDCVDVAALTGGVIPVEGEPEGEDPVEGEGEGPCPVDLSIASIVNVLVAVFDANHDGGLSLSEIGAFYPGLEAGMFALMDFDRNGILSVNEMCALAPITPPESYLGEIDPNGDGLIAYSEVSEFFTPAQFEAMDVNGNGVIDCEDVASLTGGVVPGEGEGEPSGPCPIDFSSVLQTLAPVIVSLLDSNGDGGVSLVEIQAVYPDMEAVYFTLLDANRDGKITAAELAAIAVILPVDSYIGMIDPNGDGLIAYSEVSQYLSQSQFSLLDTNRNGVIDCVDIAALTGGVIPGEGEPEGEGEPGAPCPVLDALDIPAILGYVIPLLDRNGDGGLSLAEIQAVYADLDPMYFALVDLNRDGKVTAAELGMLVNLLPLDQLLGGIDPNGDGVFSYDEVSEYIPEALFGFLDTNANGVIDCEDIAALLAGGWIPGGGEGEPPVDPDVCPIPPLSPMLAEIALALVDTDGDGGVSLAEIQAVYAAFEPVWFGLVDANGDGLVDAAELLRISGALPLDDLLGFVDANGNRVIEYAEVAAFVTPEQFAEVDVNGDGVLDCHDVEALIPSEGEPEGEPGEGEGEPVEGEGEPVEGEGEPVEVCPIPLEENLLLRAFLVLFDANRDGVISPAELNGLGVPPAVFAQLDGNRDGVLDLVELRRALRMVDVAQVMREVDTNRNGALEYAEVSTLVTPAQFALLDATGDGVLDCRDFDGVGPAEGEPEGEEGEGEPGEGEGEPGGPEDWLLRLLERLRASGDLAALMREAFALLDTNQDGALSYAEITARFALPRQVFAVLDTNRDGLITPEEIEAFVGAVPPVQPVHVELTRIMGGRFFVPEEPVTVTLRLVKRGPGLLASLNLLEVLPAGWTITNVLSSAGGAVAKADGVNNALALTWAGTMPFPMEVVYEALPAADAPRIGAFAGQADYTAASGQAFSTGVIPTVVARALPPEQAHTADTNRDWRLSLAELLRVVQLYNAGAYRAADGTEDGFAPGPGPIAGLLHSADMDGDGNISISELLRTIQLFNAPGGAYYADDGTEDGFVPGVY